MSLKGRGLISKCYQMDGSGGHLNIYLVRGL